MDEFRRPYEYEEDRISGLLLFFVILLVSIDIFLTLSLIVQGYDIIRQVPASGITFLGFSILYLLFMLFTAVTCYKVKKNMIAISKVFLGIRAIFTLLCLVMIYISALGDKNLIGNGTNQYADVTELTLVVFVLPATYMLIFSIGWFVYFTKSKKCAELVKTKNKTKPLTQR